MAAFADKFAVTMDSKYIETRQNKNQLKNNDKKKQTNKQNKSKNENKHIDIRSKESSEMFKMFETFLAKSFNLFPFFIYSGFQ